MTVPQWTLLVFASWTLLLLVSTIGTTRWYLIFAGKAQPREFRADEPHGSPRYRRAMRAHANCIENLPVYGAIVFCMTSSRLSSPLLDALAIIFIVARICQSTIHIAFIDTNRAVVIRFSFFFAQLVVMAWMAISIIAARA
jgi:uncharacterized MAPEG superfamily protein